LLQCLRDTSEKNEVVLPAYTAPSLIAAIRNAGLRPVLCDISLKDFNADHNLLQGAVSSKLWPSWRAFVRHGVDKIDLLAKALPPDVYLLKIARKV
jgi:dTDP-4-amino-4,6-dideoxygalactose transaminase